MPDLSESRRSGRNQSRRRGKEEENTPRTAWLSKRMKTLNAFSSPMVNTPVVTSFEVQKVTSSSMALFVGSIDLEKATL